MSSTATAESSGRSLTESLQEYARGIAGGILFSLPLLYTMEIWRTGVVASPVRLLVGLVGAFILLIGYNRFAGLRSDASFWEVAVDSAEELGIGIVVAALLLWLLGQIDGSMAPGEALGKIIVAAITVAIGVSVGTAQLGGSDQNTGVVGDDELQSATRQFGAQLTIAFCGAILFAANVAPTEEIIRIAFETPVWRLLILALFSLMLSALILFFSGFRGSPGVPQENRWRSIASGIVTTYAVALASSASLLWFFGRYDGLGLSTALSATIVLGVAGTIGSSAGRLLLQGGS